MSECLLWYIELEKHGFEMRLWLCVACLLCCIVSCNCEAERMIYVVVCEGMIIGLSLVERVSSSDVATFLPLSVASQSQELNSYNSVIHELIDDIALFCLLSFAKKSFGSII